MSRILRICLLASTAVLAAAWTGTAVPASSSPLVYDAGAYGVKIVPAMAARSYVAIDADSGRVLVAHRDRVRRPIASLTKMMTALLVIERGNLGGEVTVPVRATHVEPYVEGLVAGHRYPRLVLLYSALMVSSNDSAAALAWDAGGGSLDRFYASMTWKAHELGMSDTTYASAAGLDDTHNLSSARDQAILARYALANPVFERIVSTRRKVVRWSPPVYAKVWVNHNRMLSWDPTVYGVKTGWTTAAGGCLVLAARRNGHSVIAVLLDSNSIWADGPHLLDAAFARLSAG